MNFHVITLFPEMFSSFTEYGVSSRGLKKELFSTHFYNPRNYTNDAYQTIDDRPFGGGPGMVMLYEPLAKTLKDVKQNISHSGCARVIYLSPQGRPLTQKIAKEQLACDDLVLLCGRYEGIDERFIEKYIDDEISIGDYVVSGGELPAMVLMDAITRLIPGVLGSHESAVEDSFYSGLLDCPHYTRPAELDTGQKVPDILLSGHHKNIERWRLQQRLGRTYERRPDLITRQDLSEEEQMLLDDYLKAQK